MTDDMDDDFVEYGAGMRGGVTECPECGAKVPCSVLQDDEGICPKCGNKIEIEENDGDDDDEEEDDDSGDDDEGDEEAEEDDDE